MRAFLVDPPKHASLAHETLLGMHQASLNAMMPGNLLKVACCGAALCLKSAKK